VPQQLALNLALGEDATFENFYEKEATHPLTDYLKSTLLKEDELFIYLWGSSGSGLSHLLQAACHFAAEQEHTTIYFSLKDHQQLSPAILQNLQQCQLVCIDDIDCIAQQAAWEEALFHCFNQLRNAKVPLLVSAKAAPASLAFALADLKSRMQWGPTFQLTALSDSDKLAALQQRANLRGIKLSDEVGLFLLRHLSRSTHFLFESFGRLDKASWQEQRKLTIPFVKKVLNIY